MDNRDDVKKHIEAMLKAAGQAAQATQDGVLAMPALIIVVKDMKPAVRKQFGAVKDSQTLCAWMLDELKYQLQHNDGQFTPQAVMMCADRFLVFTLDLVMNDNVALVMEALRVIAQREAAQGVVVVTPSCIQQRPENFPAFLFHLLASAGIHMGDTQWGLHIWSQWKGQPQCIRFVGVNSEGRRITALVQDDVRDKLIADGGVVYTRELINFFE